MARTGEMSVVAAVLGKSTELEQDLQHLAEASQVSTSELSAMMKACAEQVVLVADNLQRWYLRHVSESQALDLGLNDLREKLAKHRGETERQLVALCLEHEKQLAEVRAFPGRPD